VGCPLKNKPSAPFAVALGLLVVSAPVLAHHGTAVFDMEKLTIVKGTVTKFEFMNPHVIVYIDVKDKNGYIDHWMAESSSNNHLSRGGYDKNTLKPGDQVAVTGHRAKNGANTLELQCQECSVVDSQGRVLLGYYF
jgi:DNA/RNA endonuclease YhcR with UshA esterase domain